MKEKRVIFSSIHIYSSHDLNFTFKETHNWSETGEQRARERKHDTKYNEMWKNEWNSAMIGATRRLAYVDVIVVRRST